MFRNMISGHQHTFDTSDCGMCAKQTRSFRPSAVKVRVSAVLVVLLAVASTPAVAANLFVPDQFGTIQDAVNAASPGDRILVAAGVYDGALIDKRLKISGDGDQTVITHGPTSAFGPFFFQNGFQIVSGGEGTNISGLKIELSPGRVGDIGALELHQTGIFGQGVDRVTVNSVKIIGVYRGIDTRDSREWRITDNTIEGLEASPFRATVGISVLRAANAFIAFNTITHSSGDNAGKQYAGIALVFGGFSGSTTTDNNTLIENEIAVLAPGADIAADIWLADFSALFGGPVSVFNNKIINNDVGSILLEPPFLEDHNVVNQND